MSDSADLKINRARKHISELEELICVSKPYTYVVGTDKGALKRYTRAKANNIAVDDIAIVAGDVVHVLRSALDHIFWRKVEPFVSSIKDRKNIQFPFRRTDADFALAVKKWEKLGVPPSFCAEVASLNACEGMGGNYILCLINKLDIVDKHRMLILTAEYTELKGNELERQVPDWPAGVSLGINDFGRSRRGDLAWSLDERHPATLLGNPIFFDGRYVRELELDIHVDIVFKDYNHPIVPTLQRLADLTEKVVDALRRA